MIERTAPIRPLDISHAALSTARTNPGVWLAKAGVAAVRRECLTGSGAKAA